MKKLVALLLPLVLAQACASDEAAKKPTTAATTTAAKPKATSTEAKDAAPAQTVSIAGAPEKPLYFDYDSEQLRPDSQEFLKQVADYLKQNPDAQIAISGHASDEGTSEYNMALGDKRARAAREYLEALGIEPKRINTISFGEEKPAVEGATDDARSKNRRDEIDVVKKDAKSAAR